MKFPRVRHTLLDTVEPPTAAERIEAEALVIRERSPKRLAERINALRRLNLRKLRPEKARGRQPLDPAYLERILRWYEDLRQEGRSRPDAIEFIANIEGRALKTIEGHLTTARKSRRESCAILV